MSLKFDPRTGWLLWGLAAVAALSAFSAFCQTSFVAVIPPDITCFLRLEAGTVRLEYYGSPVWLISTVACSRNFQDFRWCQFYFLHIPSDPSGTFAPHSELWFPIWLLLLPVLGGLAFTAGPSQPRKGSSLDQGT